MDINSILEKSNVIFSQLFIERNDKLFEMVDPDPRFDYKRIIEDPGLYFEPYYRQTKYKPNKKDRVVLQVVCIPAISSTYNPTVTFKVEDIEKQFEYIITHCPCIHTIYISESKKYKVRTVLSSRSEQYWWTDNSFYYLNKFIKYPVYIGRIDNGDIVIFRSPSYREKPSDPLSFMSIIAPIETIEADVVHIDKKGRQFYRGEICCNIADIEIEDNIIYPSNSLVGFIRNKLLDKAHDFNLYDLDRKKPDPHLDFMQ